MEIMFDPTKLKPEIRLPERCAFLEETEKHDQLMTTFYNCYYRSNFNTFDCPCWLCEFFKEK